MLNEIKLAMRITHNMLDDDIQRNINACLLDLERVGVDKTNTTELVTKACELYCKWQDDYLGKGDQFQKNYEKLRDSMSLCGDYRSTTE